MRSLLVVAVGVMLTEVSSSPSVFWGIVSSRGIAVVVPAYVVYVARAV